MKFRYADPEAAEKVRVLLESWCEQIRAQNFSIEQLVFLAGTYAHGYIGHGPAGSRAYYEELLREREDCAEEIREELIDLLAWQAHGSNGSQEQKALSDALRWAEQD